METRFFKGLPLPAGVRLSEIADLSWNVLTDVEPPMLVMHEAALEHNIETMADYCRSAGVDLAPHAKTSLSPELVVRQLNAGAWGVTAATMTQVRGLHTIGCRRILLANLLVDRSAIHWIATHVLTDPHTEFYCYVDSPASVALLEKALAEMPANQRLRVLVELGYAGGRTGIRTTQGALDLAASVVDSQHLSFAGIAGYEGLMPEVRNGNPLGMDEYLESLAGTLRSAHEGGLLAETAVPVLTAGGSSYFDHVVSAIAPGNFDFDVRSVLRSGCYVTHDHGIYERTSPLGERAVAGTERLRPALELVASVLSCPEPGRVIAGFGRRDVPIDDVLPIPLRVFNSFGEPHAAHGLTVEKLNDQHAYLRTDGTESLHPGDLLTFGISHPCGAFDRWSAIPLVDANYQITGVVTTGL